MRAVLLCVALRCAVPADPAVVLFENLGLQLSVASVAALLCVHPLLLSPPQTLPACGAGWRSCCPIALRAAWLVRTCADVVCMPPHALLPVLQARLCCLPTTGPP